MNAVFDLKRWLLYLGKHWNENKRRYLMSLAGIGGLLVLWYSFLMLVDPIDPLNLKMQAITYYVGLFITGCLFSSMMFNDLSNGPKAIHYLLTPVSSLEKLLTAIFYAMILFFISYTLVYYAVDLIMLKIGNGVSKNWFEHHHEEPHAPQVLANIFFLKRGEDNLYFYILLIFFAVQSMFLLGSVYFVKNQYIKTLVSGLVVFLFMAFFIHKIMGSILPEGSFFTPFTVYRVWNSKQGDVMILLPEWFSSMLLFLIKYALAPALWVVAYFRLKEKEV